LAGRDDLDDVGPAFDKEYVRRQGGQEDLNLAILTEISFSREDHAEGAGEGARTRFGRHADQLTEDATVVMLLRETGSREQNA